jgi:hypothetical protein
MKVHDKEDEINETDEEKKIREAKEKGKLSVPGPKSVTCPKCVTEFDGSTGDIVKEKDEEPDAPTLDEETDHKEETYITPPLMDDSE